MLREDLFVLIPLIIIFTTLFIFIIHNSLYFSEKEKVLELYQETSLISYSVMNQFSNGQGGLNITFNPGYRNFSELNLPENLNFKVQIKDIENNKNWTWQNVNGKKNLKIVKEYPTYITLNETKNDLAMVEIYVFE